MSINEIPRNPSESYTGHEVIGSDGETVGKVTDVVYDDTTNQPTWLVVKPGFLRAEHYAPVEGSYTTEDGNIVLPFDKQWLKAAPVASGDHVMDSGLQRDLVHHYGRSVD
ncbi:MAG: PRC-barrel domain-containing protein [Ilumatobacter sp.]